MKKKILIILSIAVLLCSIFVTWYYFSIPRTEALKQTAQRYGGVLAYGTGVPISEAETNAYIATLDKYEWLSGVCSPFQKNIQSILLTYKKDQNSEAYIQVYLLDKPGGKVSKTLNFNSSKSWSDTISYIKSNCLAHIFSNRDKYKEIYRGGDSNMLTEIDYADEYQKYLTKQKNDGLAKIACGEPNMYLEFSASRSFSRKITAEEFRICANALQNNDPETPLDRAVGLAGYPDLLKAVEASQKLP